MEIERMLEEKMEEDVQKQDGPATNNKNGEKKDRDKDKDNEKDKKHKKHHKHHKHKSHKSEKKHDRKDSRSPRRSRSPKERRQRTPTPPTLASGKRRDVNSELHQLAKTISRQTNSKEAPPSSSKSGRRDKSPELTPEERDLRTVFCMIECSLD